MEETLIKVMEITLGVLPNTPQEEKLIKDELEKLKTNK